MKKLAFTLSLYLLLFVSIKAQTCFPEGITFETQNDVIEFTENYSDCTIIEGDLTISGSALSDFMDLSNISVIEVLGNLRIEQNFNNDFDYVDLGAIKKIHGDFTFGHAINMTVITEIDSILGRLELHGNSFDKLDFQTLQYIDTFYINESFMQEFSMPSLIDADLDFYLAFFSSFSLPNFEVGSISLVESTLPSFNLPKYSQITNLFVNYSYFPDCFALPNLENIDGPFFIVNNFGFYEECDFTWLCPFIHANNELEFADNEPFQSLEDIFCPNFSMSGNLFLDYNQNGDFDTEDSYLENIAVTDQNTNSYFSNKDGFWFKNIVANESNTITMSDPRFIVTSDSSSYTRNIEDGINNLTNLDFGMFPIQQDENWEIEITTNRAVCNTNSTFIVRARNIGITPSQAQIDLNFNEFVDYLSSNAPDATYDDANRTIAWQTEEIGIYQEVIYEIVMAVADEQNVGEMIELNGLATDLNNNLISETVFQQVLLCAYDPNDKRVMPVPLGDNNVIGRGTAINFRIRFENEGNFPASDIVVVDSIDNDLDLSSFRINSSSHSVNTSIDLENRVVSFQFLNINLPPSVENSDIGKGYVNFTLEHDQQVVNGTPIENTAYIYFDSNAPIVTNQVAFTIDLFDIDNDGYAEDVDCNDMDENVNPGMDEIPYNGIDDDCDPETLDDDLDQDGYNLAEDCDDMNENINPGLDEIPYNGIDDDCNTATLDDDLDQDGFVLADDCDDTNPDINPDAEEIPNNGIDEDCDGTDLLVGVLDLEGFEINIYPNPTTDLLFIEHSKEIKLRFKILTNSGAIILEKEDSDFINLDNFAPGVYFLRIEEVTSGISKMQRIVVL